MKKEELEKKRSDIESIFNEKKAAREEHLTQAASLLDEMNQLKGAYQILDELLVEEKPSVKVKGEK